jgi:hypothetical protein
MNELEPIPPPTESDTVPPSIETTPVPRRPFNVTLLAVGVIIISALSLTRFALALRYWNYLDTMTNASPWYLALSGLLWGLAGIPLVWGLLQGKGWAPRFMSAIALTYAAYFWLDQLFLQDHPLNGAEGGAKLLLPGNWTFEAGLTVVLLAYIVWTLNRRTTRFYFGDVNEHRPENETLT